ncbi:MAG: KEOPS complex kinase/ATPase Bud32 [Candidatus Woesearchaeota archaeon]
MKLIAIGAEAKIYEDSDYIIKIREKKEYRNSILDFYLRKSRTLREIKVLKLLVGICPKYIFFDKDKMLIKMEKLNGKKVSEVINKKNYKIICEGIAKNLLFMHNLNVIHGDLTTSNMIYNEKVYFIDFGLSYFSRKIEDMAVDLHLLKQAFDSKHSKISKICFSEIMKHYTNKEVLKRLEIVEMRGRNKNK